MSWDWVGSLRQKSHLNHSAHPLATLPCFPTALFCTIFLVRFKTFHITGFQPPMSEFFSLWDLIARKELLKMQPHPAVSLHQSTIEYKAGILTDHPVQFCAYRQIQLQLKHFWQMCFQPALEDLSLFWKAMPELACSRYYEVFLMLKCFLLHFTLTASPYLSQGDMDYSYHLFILSLRYFNTFCTPVRVWNMD